MSLGLLTIGAEPDPLFFRFLLRFAEDERSLTVPDPLALRALVVRQEGPPRDWGRLLNTFWMQRYLDLQ